MIALEPTIQSLTGVFFFALGVYFLVSKKVKSTNLFEDITKKVGGGFLIAFGIFIVLLTIVLPQPKAWRIGETVLLATAAITCTFSGVYNLSYRRRTIMSPSAKKAVGVIGGSLILLGLWTGMVFILSISKGLR
jgi:glucan phosphoethanolaminetransferase (alkaline phosphatase superfamily)